MYCFFFELWKKWTIDGRDNRVTWSRRSNQKPCCCKGPGKRWHIVADTNVSPFAHAGNICCGHKKCFWFCSETFVSATNVSQFAQHKKHEQQCVRNNVSSFARAFTMCQSIQSSWLVFGFNSENINLEVDPHLIASVNFSFSLFIFGAGGGGRAVGRSDLYWPRQCSSYLECRMNSQRESWYRKNC